MRHHVPELIQQQQQNYIAMKQQSKLQYLQEPQQNSQPDQFIINSSSSTSLLNTKSVYSSSTNLINDCLINVSNNNGHYQIVPQSQQPVQKSTSTGTVMTSIAGKIPTSAGIQSKIYKILKCFTTQDFFFPF